MKVLPDQRSHWTRLHARGRQDGGPSEFVRSTAPSLAEHSRVLELGCGQGEDAAYLARLGHDIIACDFVEAVVEANRERFRNTNGLTFRVMRTDEPFPDAAGSFDAVYAHLTLHYFRHDVTEKIFGEIQRVLRPAGLLAFACKSDRDPLYGQGTPTEPDMFELNGHVRHFFPERYAGRLLDRAFDIDHLVIRPLDQNGTTSSVIKVIARER